MEDEEVSLFLVASFDQSPICAAIYEIKLRGGGEGGSESESESATVVSPVVKAFRYYEEGRTTYPSVGCDILGSQICLIASYYKSTKGKYIQLQPLLFDTNTKEISNLPMPKATKTFPKVMALHGRGFFVLNGDGRNFSVLNGGGGNIIKYPSFERLDPTTINDDDDQEWDSSSLPHQFQGWEEKLPMTVLGYAVVKDCILISVQDTNESPHLCQTHFYCYRVGSTNSMEEWQLVKKDKEDGSYFHLDGKAEYVDGWVYSCLNQYDLFLIAYHVRFSDDDDGIIQSLAIPLLFTGVEFADFAYPPAGYDNLRDWSCSNCFVHLGGKIFCLMKTGFLSDLSLVQYVSILIVKVSKDMQLSTLSSVARALNIKGLGPATLTSIFYPQQVQNASKSEWWTNLQGVNNTDQPNLEGSQPDTKRVPSSAFSEKRIKAESVDCLLEQLGLQKYSSIFKNEEIDMTILIHMTDEDLKSIGLPKGPRKKIFSSLTFGS